MAAEGSRRKRKAIDQTPAEISKRTKTTTPVAAEQTTSTSIYKATVQTEEEDEAAHADAIVIDSSASEKGDNEVEDPAESSDAELKRLMKDWGSPIYAFFEPTPRIEYHDSRHCHVFKCAAPGSSGKSKLTI
ncbi:hypothetical protein P692DRAFT_201873927 [Suillus brevipes Sb2]|nr:hypothetical protein P692DRAFT_201873927 [Suillus brevipes Sb2]